MLREVRQAHEDRLDAERYERLMVDKARAAHASWDRIGPVVGMSGEGARRRYGHHATDRRRRYGEAPKD